MEVHGSNRYFKLEPRRWLMLFLFACNCIVNNLVWLTFAPITDRAVIFYGRTPLEINSISILFMVAGLVLCLPGSWLIDKKGLRVALISSAALTFIGLWVRCLSWFFHPEDGFWLVLAGSAIVSIAQPPLVVGSPKLASTWFGEHERATATSLASLSNLVGMGLAFCLGPILVPHGLKFARLYLIEACIGTASSLAILLFYSAAPSSPPSSSAHSSSDEPFLPALNALRKQSNYVIFTAAFGLGYGMFSALFTVLDQIVEPQGYKHGDSGLFGTIMIGSGVVGGIIGGIILDKTRAYRATIMVLFSGSAVSMAMLYLCLYGPEVLQQEYLVIICCVLLGGFAIATLPVAMDAAVEICYPIGEAAVTGVLMLVGNLCSAAATAVAGVLQAPNDGTMIHAMQFFAVLGGVTLAGMCCFRGPYKRKEYEQRHSYLPISS